MDRLSRDAEQLKIEQIRNEIAEVRGELFAELAELASPLGELVRSQLERSVSNRRIGLLLAAASRPEDSAQARQQRILLGAAFEMLFLALSIHKLLLAYSQSNGNPTPERSWTGSVILAGDYCFSRSAMLAAQTDLPPVVTIFASALKTVSEELLRRLFHSAVTLEDSFDEERELVKAGLQAATVISGLDHPTTLATIDFGQDLFRQLSTTSPITQFQAPPYPLTAFQHSRWQALLTLDRVSA